MKEDKLNEIFLSNDPKLQSKLRLLGACFTHAVSEDNVELARRILKEAKLLQRQGCQSQKYIT